MKNFIKKSAVATLSVLGILSAMPSALCAPKVVDYSSPFNNEGKVDNHSAMIVGKYLGSAQDLYRLVRVNKKYRSILEKYYGNFVKITSKNDLEKCYPNIETYYIRNCEEEYIPTFEDRVENVHILPGSFNLLQFLEVLRRNKIIDRYNRYFGNWQRRFELNDENPVNGCKLTFTFTGNGKRKTIVFMFDPRVGGTLGNVEKYNRFLKEFNVELTDEERKAATIDISGVFHIPASVKSIGDMAFGGCTDLTSVDIPTSVKSIGEWAFGFCDHLTSINIPTSVTSIENGTFCFCTNLNSVNIPTSVKNIGNGAFCCCINLTSINIPTSVESIGDEVFNGCKRLSQIKFDGKTYRSVDDFMAAFNTYRENHR